MQIYDIFSLEMCERIDIWYWPILKIKGQGYVEVFSNYRKNWSLVAIVITAPIANNCYTIIFNIFMLLIIDFTVIIIAIILPIDIISLLLM